MNNKKLIGFLIFIILILLITNIVYFNRYYYEKNSTIYYRTLITNSIRNNIKNDTTIHAKPIVKPVKKQTTPKKKRNFTSAEERIKRFMLNWKDEVNKK